MSNVTLDIAGLAAQGIVSGRQFGIAAGRLLRRGLDPACRRFDAGRRPCDPIPFHRGMINQKGLAGQNVGRRSCE